MQKPLKANKSKVINGIDPQKEFLMKSFPGYLSLIAKIPEKHKSLSARLKVHHRDLIKPYSIT